MNRYTEPRRALKAKLVELYVDLIANDPEYAALKGLRTPEEQADHELTGFPDEMPQHIVTISKGFWMADSVCTQELYAAVMCNNPSFFHPSCSGHPGSLQHPVERVSWTDVQEFFRRIPGTAAGSLDLPTEAEWEYACRAGTETAFNFGESVTDGLVNRDSNGDGPPHTVPALTPFAKMYNPWDFVRCMAMCGRCVLTHCVSTPLKT